MLSWPQCITLNMDSLEKANSNHIAKLKVAE